MRTASLLIALLVPLAAIAAGGDKAFAPVEGGSFQSVLAYDETKGRVQVPGFELMREPVTNADFLAFVKKHPQWRRGQAPGVFAESRYLAHWAEPLKLGEKAKADQPVVQVSWFAAVAYCESLGARLPTWNEWEFAAAADATRKDAREDPAWTQRILEWYGRPSTAPLPTTGEKAPNVYGIHDLHGLVWEWVDDFGSMRVSSGSRGEKQPDGMTFCGAGSLSMNDRENYAVLMRTAMLSSLEARGVTVNLGFRCARTAPGGTK